MNSATQRMQIAGPAGPLECAVDESAGATARGFALVCHPHPLHGGTMDNKVVQTMARAFVQLGWRTVRFNFRGVGASAGQWDEGRGEVDDAMAVLKGLRSAPGQAIAVGGFSFGGYVTSQVARRLAEAGQPVERLTLVAPAVKNFDVAAVPPGTLVIHGEADDVVPLGDVLDWARPQSQPITVVPGAGHFFHGQLPLLKSLILTAMR